MRSGQLFDGADPLFTFESGAGRYGQRPKTVSVEQPRGVFAGKIGSWNRRGPRAETLGSTARSSAESLPAVYWRWPNGGTSAGVLRSQRAAVFRRRPVCRARASGSR